MPTHQITVHVVDCDICGQPFDRDDTVIHFNTADEGITYVLGARWLRLDDGRLVCTNPDLAHDLARIPGVAA